MSNLNDGDVSNLLSAALAGIAGSISYENYERVGVILLSTAALLSITAIIFMTIAGPVSTRMSYKTHIFEYVACLLVANLIQSVGTAMNLRWVVNNGVSNGSFCTAQGAIKQGGNLATATWSFLVSVHLFNILFLRTAVTKVGLWCTIIGGWLLVTVVVLIGPVAIQKREKGPYFGISGTWCWITSGYPSERVFLEYFLEFFSACLSFILYCIILLRVRGNLVHNMGEWRLKFISKDASWRLGFARDLIDSSMLKCAQRIVWLPVAYTFCLLPITITRLTEFSGHQVPFGATVFADMVFSLTGFVNVMLIIITKRVFPDLETLPEFSTPRNKLLDVVFGKSGVTPFTLERSDTADTFRRQREERLNAVRAASPQQLPSLQRSNSSDSAMTQASTANLIIK
ncbi:hypothetical protein E1B28_005247 [Marasmius oreades]|uniref:Glucose receptor Git3 N-terminal domain-containing protein n=1 Tax=Marasmius oreades TaxID=181124 RepID=A0A9P7V0C6_9AGAR|nr:uncharacterized protein E1B28_005247 [Marasmius oreades]KAG7097936.1 hypothetical protein E1B28_005247 [Marasmius oreades]